MGARVLDVINQQVKQLKAEKKAYYAATDWRQIGTGNLKPHMLSAKLEQLNILKRSLRKAKLI